MSRPTALGGHTAAGDSDLAGDSTHHAAAFDLDTGTITDLGTLGGD